MLRRGIVAVSTDAMVLVDLTLACRLGLLDVVDDCRQLLDGFRLDLTVGLHEQHVTDLEQVDDLVIV